MLRIEHNNKDGKARRGTDNVRHWDTEYDARCAACWLGHAHTWDTHDWNIARHEVWGKRRGAWVNPHSVAVVAAQRQFLAQVTQRVRRRQLWRWYAHRSHCHA